MSKRQSRLVLGTATAVLAALLATFALALTNSQTKARNDVKGRFRERALVSASLTQALFGTAASEAGAQNSKLYGGATVAPAALARQQRQSGSPGGYLAVVDSSGRLLAASPGAPANLTALLAATAHELAAVVHGQPYSLPDVLGAGGASPTMQLLEPFPTRYGKRVLVSGFSPKLLAAFIGGYLAQVPNTQGGHAYALDSRGNVIASTDPRQAPGQRVSEPGLLSALARTHEGEFGSRYLAAEPVRDSTWRVVLTAPTSRLFASVNGTRKWVPWVLFIAFAAAALIAVAMLRGVLVSTSLVTAANDRLGDANRKLAVTNRALEQRATELARSNSELEQFASIASHDLQEPLRKVQTFSEQLRLREAEHLSESGRDYLVRMSAAARRMQDLIDDLLRFSRVTTHTRPFVPVDLGLVAREVSADLEAVIAETGATVEIGELPTVAADPSQMRQLLQNLLSNALKFHREGVAPVVQLSGAVRGRLAEISVTDNGIGFEERYTQRIFRVFERLHGRGAYPGTGIGLALCRKIAERHGGKIVAHSVLGEGSRFIVFLPLEHPDEQLDPFAELELDAAAAQSGPGTRSALAASPAADGDRKEKPYVAV